jgi:sodium/hydrogen exchanger-like protein 6/7
LPQVTDEYAEKLHFTQSVAVMISVSLLIVTIVTIWAFKKSRLRFVHETGMSVLYGVHNNKRLYLPPAWLWPARQ